MIFQFIFLVGFVAYFTHWLLFDPYFVSVFESKSIFVKVYLLEDGESITVTRHIDLTDRIRKIFGAYKLSPDDSNIWNVEPDKMRVWDCPYCLAFWLSFLVSWNFWYFFIDYTLLQQIFFTIVTHFACALFAAILVRNDAFNA